MKTITIGGRIIGAGQPCFIIAEAGVNHNGDPALARRLVEAAKDTGADAVKFQTWITEKLVAPDAALAEYQRKNTEAASQFELLKKLELGQDAFRELQAHAKRTGILFLSTPDEEESCDFLVKLGVPAIKIGSGEVTNLPYLHHVARKGRPIILSTGMSTLDEVEAAVRAIEAEDNRELVLLHCVSQYPAQAEDCNLRAMKTLKDAFGYPVGFSDHTLGMEVALAAVALGACVIEKHFTLDRSMPGPDHQASLAPAEMKALVAAVRRVEQALGDGVKRPTESELETRKVVQKSIVAARDLDGGTELLATDLKLLRASGGLGPTELGRLCGRRLVRPLRAGQPITWSDVR